ncbi:hypothetical protein EsH8_I_000301 [Colletotrichum jinshuiense]
MQRNLVPGNTDDDDDEGRGSRETAESPQETPDSLQETAERPREVTEHADLLSRLASMQSMFRDTAGRAPVEIEMSMRAHLAEIFLQFGSQYHERQPIDDAIQHLDAILLHVQEDSPDRPKYLNSLSSANLALAVKYGRQARDLASTTGLQERDRELYIKILTNLGHILAYQYRILDSQQDIEDSIACKREILSLAPKGSDSHHLALNNLAATLHRQYVLDNREEDNEEAQMLVRELLDSTAVGTKMHSIAVGQLGIMTITKFRQTELQEDLEYALVSCKTAFEALEPSDDAWSEMLQQLVVLSMERHGYTQDQTDMENSVRYSCLLFDSIPASHSSRGMNLVRHLIHLKKYAFASRSVQVIDHAIKLTKVALSNMPASYPEKSTSKILLSYILSQRYSISHTLDDLKSLVDLTTTMLTEHNAEISSGTSQQSFPVDWAWDLAGTLSKFTSISLEAPILQQVEKELLAAFNSSYDVDPGAKPHEVLHRMHAENGLRWQVMADDGMAFRVKTDEEIEEKIFEINSQIAAENAEREMLRDTHPLKMEEYKNEFGARTLAIDPETKNIIFDFGGMFGDFLGYDPEPVSPAEFIKREEQMEQKMLEQGRSEGKHPNTRLCRLCRTATRLLQPTTEGFELSAKNCMIPIIGDWKMILYCRSRCAICSLVASLIITPSGNLHPEFEKADQEVRGLRPSSGRLSTGESVLRVDFGLTWAGELRVLTPKNVLQALRQGWETDTKVLLQTTIEDLNSPVNIQSGQQVNPKLIKKWLTDCGHNHGSACSHPRAGDRIKSEIPLYLIDTIQECLVSGTSKQRYFALSYTWGHVDMGMTKLDNVEERRQPQALSTVPFPRTIRDAMNLVRSLGERFLWVDAICIVQDDLEQKARDIPNMDIVYGKAFATIVALHGNNADAGLPGVAPGTRPPQRIETIVVSNKSPDLDHDPVCKFNEVVNIVATPRPLHLALKASNWNTRGWIMQERLLSRRAIYFSSEAVYFQCGQHTLTEGGVNEEFKTFFLNSAMNDEQRLKRQNHDNPVADLEYMHDLDVGARLWKAFRAYIELVETYSKREFTCKADIIDGFSGIFAVLDEQHFQGSVESKTLHGLPGSIFIHALMWSPAARIPRRGVRFATEKDLKDLKLGTLSIDIGEPDLRFPSWSWAGWDGPVEYRLFDWATDLTERPVPLVEQLEVGGLEILPDGHAESTCLSETSDFRNKGKQTRFGDDLTQPGRSHDSSHRVSTPGGSKKLENASSLPDLGGGAQETISDEEVWKGKEKKMQEEQTVAKLWQDPNSEKLWLWLTPPGHAANRLKEPPDMATVLQMRAPAVLLSAFNIAANKEYLSDKTQVHSQGPQSVRRIYDSDGNHCGLWWEQGGYEWVGNGIYPEAEKELVMVGILAYGVCYRPREGPFRVEGRIKMFDNEVFDAVGENSGLVNILVVDENMGYQDGTGHRCTVAVIHVEAWERADPVKRQVRLA